MKIIVKNNDSSTHHDFIVYLKTDDDINVYAQLATIATYDDVIANVRNQSNEDIDLIQIDTSNIKEKEMNDKNIPLILVFYLDRELMNNPQIIKPFADSVNDAIALRDANAMAFFLPTDGPERIECINPQLATSEEKSRITKLIDDISTNFDIGQGADEDYDDVNMINTGGDED